MNLTRGDHRWMGAFIHSAQHRQILAARLEEEKLLAPRRSRWALAARNLWGLLRLCAELILAAARRAPGAETPGAVFFDSSPASLAARGAFLRYHRPATTFHGLSLASRLHGRLPAHEWLPALARLAGFALRSLLFPGALSAHALRITRSCLLASAYLRAAGQREIYLFRLYQIETNFLAAYLRERGVQVNLIPSTTPLTPFNQRLIGDCLLACNPYQRDEFARYAALGTCQRVELWSPEDIVPLAEYYAPRARPALPRRLGLYTQGFWLRAQMNLMPASLVEALAQHEQGLIAALLAVLGAQPDFRLAVYPHPLERRHYQKTGQHQFAALAGQDQITLDFSAANSMYTFDQVGLGLTTVSTIGFDRIFLGFRTLFYIPSDHFLDTRLPSAYQSVFCATPEALQQKIAETQAMPHAEFMQRVFGGEFWQPQPAAHEVSA